MAAVLFLGGQGAMSTQHVGLEMNSLFYPYMDFSILLPTEEKRETRKKISSNITSLLFFSQNDQQDVTEKQRRTVFMRHQVALNVTDYKKRGGTIS